MKAARIHRFGGPEAIVVEDIPLPEPGPDEVRIRVTAASVNPVDYKIRQGGYLPQDKLPLVLGRDVAGVIDRIGAAGATDLREGDGVIAMLAPDHGGNAEFALAKTNTCAPWPAALDSAAAGSLGLAALTAWQGLFDQGGLREGQRVLIHAGAGGVGHLAVQFARCRGAQVVATCRSDDMDFVRGLGAETVIDYERERFEDRAGEVDVVFDLVAGETQDRSWTVLREGGILVSTLAAPDTSKAGGRDVRGAHYMAQPNGGQLAEVTAMINAGLVHPHVDRTLPLDAVAEAHRVLEQGHIRGKLVLTVG